MIRFIFRFFGLWILAAAFIFLIYDGTKSIADRTDFFITRTRSLWEGMHQNSLIALQALIQDKAPWFAEPFDLAILNQPAWAVLGVIGILLILIGRKKKPLIGYGRD
jgi:hypothetical protein